MSRRSGPMQHSSDPSNTNMATDPTAGQTDQWSTIADQGSRLNDFDFVDTAHHGHDRPGYAEPQPSQPDGQASSSGRRRRRRRNNTSSSASRRAGQTINAADRTSLARAESWENNHRVFNAAQTSESSDQRVDREESRVRNELHTLSQNLPMYFRNGRPPAGVILYDRDGMLDDLDELDFDLRQNNHNNQQQLPPPRL